ncbi:MAG: DUF4340 domain-containing protein [Clostridia bacterium]|nr:DUF4340 domain-containing protein [Clostridia bacterium]
MQGVERKTSRTPRLARWMYLALALMLLAGAAGAYLLLAREEPQPAMTDAITYGELFVHEEKDVQRVALTLRSGESWAMARQADGTFLLEGERDWRVSDAKAAQLLRLTAVISYDDVLTEDAAAYAEHMADFGLVQPLVVTVDYADGQQVTMRIGASSGMTDETWYYMTVDGDPRLFAVDKGTAEGLSVERALLHPVTQPTLHKSRMAEITFYGSAGDVLAAWTLQGAITDSDAAGSWMMTAPYRYPVDAEAMDALRSNLANIRLGAYEGQATPDNLTRCGLDDPQFVLTVRQAAGTTNVTGADGSISPVDWPESTFTLSVGGAKNDNVYYVQVEDSIYLTSRFSMATFMDMEPLTTISRYPVMVASTQLDSFTVETAAGTEDYRITREPRVAENNALLTDEEGNTVYDVTCTRNGESVPWDAFEAAYLRLETVRVSGILPDGWQVVEPAHTIFTLRTTAGTEHTIALAPFDALHDAVIVDGCALFYLIRGGMSFGME